MFITDPHTPVSATVIVPAYNAEATLAQCLNALVSQKTDVDFEIIVVNDASTDRTAEIAQSFAGVRVLENGKLGKSGTRNFGAQNARGGLLLFTDSDCVPSSDWVTEITKVFADSAVVGAKGTYSARPTHPIAQFVQIEHEERYDLMAQQTQIDFIDTYSAAYRRGVFLENGGFDMQLTQSMVEDQELSFRLATKGEKMVFVPTARVGHRHPTTLVHYARRKFWIASWKVLILQRHPARLGSDSRTPFSLKAQMGLALGVLLLTPLLLVSKLARRLAYMAILGIGGSSVGYLGRVFQKSPSLLPTAIGLILVRAFALAAGYIHGHLTWRGQKAADFLAKSPPPLTTHP